MKNEKREIRGGVYLVVDPSILNSTAIRKIQKALDCGLAAIQLWNNWKEVKGKAETIQRITKLAHPYDVPVIINENWELLSDSDADGIHLDLPSDNLSLIRAAAGRPLITGLTCGNDPNTVQFAVDQQMDYISFCSVFPSATANSCEWVKPATIAAARANTSMPIFAAGGITADNLPDLLPTGLNGVAVVNSIMKADDPAAVTNAFNQLLQLQKTI